MKLQIWGKKSSAYCAQKRANMSQKNKYLFFYLKVYIMWDVCIYFFQFILIVIRMEGCCIFKIAILKSFLSLEIQTLLKSLEKLYNFSIPTILLIVSFISGRKIYLSFVSTIFLLMKNYVIGLLIGLKKFYEFKEIYYFNLQKKKMSVLRM